MKEADAKVAALEGTQPYGQLPSEKAAPTGKHVFIIPEDFSLSGIHRMTLAEEAAVKALGWTYTLVDGQGSPNAMTEGIDRAISEHANGILLVAIDSQLVSAAVQQARAANIPVVDVTSGSPVGPDGVNAEISSISYNSQMGQAAAWYAIAASHAHAKVVVFRDTSFTIAPPIADGFVSVIKQCSTCQVLDVVNYTDTNLPTTFPELVNSTLERYPDATYVFTIADVYAIYAKQGIETAGSSAQILSTGGDEPNLALIRAGNTQVATTAEPLAYFGWLSVDAMVRLMNGEQVPAFNAPMKLLVRSNLPPAGQAWDGDSDFTHIFLSLWHR